MSPFRFFQCAQESGHGSCACAGSLETEVQGWQRTGASAVEAYTRALREGGLPSPRAPGRCGRTSDLSSISPPLHSRALGPHGVLGLAVPVQNTGAQILSAPYM